MQKNYYAIIPANVRYDKDLPPNAKLLYGEITALCNDKGYCWAGNAYFSELYQVHNKSISRLISQLEKKGYIRIEMQLEGKEIKNRHIYIVPSNDNVPTYPLNCEEGSNKNVTRGSNEIVTDNNTLFNTTNNMSGFEEFWRIYPKKIDKKKAEKSFKTCLKKHSLEVILFGTKKYAEEAKNKDKQFIKYPATFLNNESFLNDYEEPKQEVKREVEKVVSPIAGFWREDYE